MTDKRVTIEGRDRHTEKMLRWARNRGSSIRVVPARAVAKKSAKKSK